MLPLALYKRILEADAWVRQEYTVRRLEGGKFEVAMFRGSAAPLKVYTVQHGHCTCPGYVHGDPEHKHLRIVRAHKRLNGMPALYWFEQGKLQWIKLFGE